MTVELQDRIAPGKPARTIDADVPDPDASTLEPIELTMEPTYDEIAAEAYARFVARGRADGGDVADWLEAEEALRNVRRTTGRAR
jgi:Protein of unknown function (DUF2934)